jgi:hypothetical protein
LKVKTLFYSLTSIRIILYFIIIKFKNHIFNMHLNIFQKNESTCIDVWVLQNWLQVDESRSILIFLYFQVNGDLKHTYVFSNCTYYNVSKFVCKIYFEHCIDYLVSKLLITYFYYTKVMKFSIHFTTNPMEVMMVLYFFLGSF